MTAVHFLRPCYAMSMKKEMSRHYIIFAPKQENEVVEDSFRTLPLLEASFLASVVAELSVRRSSYFNFTQQIQNAILNAKF